MSRRDQALGALLLLCAGCGRPGPLRIELPEIAGARALVVALTSGARSPEIVAVDLADPSALGALSVPAHPGDEEVRVTVLYYPDPLASLGLRPGPLVLAGPEQPSHGLPTFQSAREAIFRDAPPAEVEWRVVGSLTPPLSELRLPFSDCARFSSMQRVLTATKTAQFNVYADPDHALIGTGDRRLYLVGRTGTVEELALPPGAPTIYGAARDDEGSIWFGADGGELWRGRYSDHLELALVSRSPSRQRIHWISLGPTPAGTEIYTLTVQGAFEQYAGGRWRGLHQFQYDVGGDERGGVAWIGPGEALAAYGNASELIRLRGGIVSEERPTAMLAGFASVAVVPGYGVVAGDYRGGLFRESLGVWSPISDSPVGLPRDKIIPYEDGFLFAGVNGFLGQYRPSRGFCPLEQIAGHSIRDVLILGDDLILSGVRGDTQIYGVVTVLHRAR